MALTGREKQLTPQKRAVLDSLITVGSVRAASKEHGVPERTIYRWMKTQIFTTTLEKAQTDAMAEAGRLLASSSGDAVRRLIIEVGNTGDGTPATRIRAATAILEHMLTIRQLTDFETRLAALEQNAGLVQ